MHHWHDQSFKPCSPCLLLQLGRKQESIIDKEQSQRFATRAWHDGIVS